MTAVQVEAFVAPEPSDPSELVPELTRLALASASKAEFRGRALALLSCALPFDRAVWEEVPPFGDVRVLYPGVSWAEGRDGAGRGPGPGGGGGRRGGRFGRGEGRGAPSPGPRALRAAASGAHGGAGRGGVR